MRSKGRACLRFHDGSAASAGFASSVVELDAAAGASSALEPSFCRSLRSIHCLDTCNAPSSLISHKHRWRFCFVSPRIFERSYPSSLRGVFVFFVVVWFRCVFVVVWFRCDSVRCTKCCDSSLKMQEIV